MLETVGAVWECSRSFGLAAVKHSLTATPSIVEVHANRRRRIAFIVEHGSGDRPAADQHNIFDLDFGAWIDGASVGCRAGVVRVGDVDEILRVGW